MKSWEQRIGDVLSVLRMDSIRRKIVVLALLATLIPTLSTAFLSYRQNRAALTEALEAELSTIGSQAARELDLWVRERFSDVRVFASSFEVTENLERVPQGGGIGDVARTRLRDYLRGVESRFDDYTELSVADADLQPIASSGDTLARIDLTQGWIAELRRGETMFSDPVWDASREQVVATIAVPVESTAGRFIGVLTATVTFAEVQETLDNLEPGEEGRILLVTEDGHGIAVSRDLAVLGPEPLVTEETLALLVATPGAAEYVGLTGSEVVGRLTDVLRLDWLVIAEVPQSEAYAQIADLRNSALTLLLVLLIIVGAIAYSLGLFIVRPLGRLASGAGAVAAGDLSVDLPVTGKGEVAYLTSTFNEMVRRLRETREQLDEVNDELRQRNQELERLSVTDALTGLHNRRHIMATLEKEMERADRQKRPLCVLMLDVDQFKLYNDTYGHLAGDKVLMGMGSVLEDATRNLDFCARYGGEEFIVVLPDCEIAGALDAADRLRKRLGEETFEGGAVTISIGAAQYPAHGDGPTEIIAAADVALYEAKRQGRDRAVAAPAAPTGEKSPRAKGTAKRRPADKTKTKKTAAMKPKTR